jgi:hypothetical protein
MRLVVVVRWWSHWDDRGLHERGRGRPGSPQPAVVEEDKVCYRNVILRAIQKGPPCNVFRDIELLGHKLKEGLIPVHISILEKRLFRGEAEVGGEGSLEPLVLADLGDGDALQGIHNEHVSDQVFAGGGEVSRHMIHSLLDFLEQGRHRVFVKREAATEQGIQNDATTHSQVTFGSSNCMRSRISILKRKSDPPREPGNLLFQAAGYLRGK